MCGFRTPVPGIERIDDRIVGGSGYKHAVRRGLGTRIGATAAVLIVTACADAPTGIRLHVERDAVEVQLEAYDVRVAGRTARTLPADVLELLVAQPRTDAATAVEVWGVAGDSPIMYGAAEVALEPHQFVDATVTLASLDCDAGCTLGDARCENNGVVTCEHDSLGCPAWGGARACPSDLPFCSAGTCAATCTDECDPGAIRCVDDGARAECGEHDEDPCRDWSAPIGCGTGQRCDAGICGSSCQTVQVLRNGAFDEMPEEVGWTEQPFDFDDLITAMDISGAAEHTPPFKAWLGGEVSTLNFVVRTDRLYQDLTIPTGTTQLEVSGQTRLFTSEDSEFLEPRDRLSIGFSSGGTDTEVFAIDSAAPAGWQPFTRAITNLPPIVGGTLRFWVASGNNSTDASDFWVDSLSVTATVCP